MAFPWGSLISAGGSILGGLLGGGGNQAEGGGAKKAKHHQLDYDRRRIKALVDGAGDAGIHPLVALGASGSGGFAAPIPVSGSGGDNWASAVAQGIGAFGDLYQQDADMEQARRDRADDYKFQQILRDNTPSGPSEHEIRLAEAQIKMFEAQAAESAARAAAVGAKAPMTLMNGGPRSFNVGGIPFELRPGTSTASEAQDIGGEPFEWGVAVDTLLYNLEQWAKRKDRELLEWLKRQKPTAGGDTWTGAP